MQIVEAGQPNEINYSQWIFLKQPIRYCSPQPPDFWRTCGAFTRILL
jgi:hypothetical protein